MTKSNKPTKTAPLTTRQPTDPVLLQQHPTIRTGQNPVSIAQLLAEIQHLAQQLPEHGYAINLCTDRHRLLLSFYAVILRGQCNLLPPNQTIAARRQLAASYPDCYIIQDDELEPCGIKQLDLRKLTPLASPAVADFVVPEIPLAQLAAIAFTSGSTGTPQAIKKYWRTLVHSTLINRDYYLPAAAQPHYLLATVPGQHMWGLETSILLPLFSPVCVSNNQALLPQDILTALAALPEPRLLVTTPLHLRSIQKSQLRLPKTARILSATAALDRQLAEQLEKMNNTAIREIYGCSEAGSLAYRDTSKTADWTLFHDFKLAQTATETRVNAAHLPDTNILLQDSLELITDRNFKLLGRAADLLKIAGKRHSLAAINQILLQAPGVEDAVAFLPEQKTDVDVRVAAFVVIDTTQTNRARLKEYLTEQLDPAFIPRPIYEVTALPRSPNGKLPQAVLLDMLQTLKTKPDKSY